MTEADTFVDYYSILDLDPGCDAKSLEAAYRHLAKLYHPDHAETTDVTKFGEVIDAFRVLRNPEKRAAYDQLYYAKVPGASYRLHARTAIDELTAVSDADAHQKILLLLYKRRREAPHDAGVVAFYVKEAIMCSDALFEFHLWYLKSRGFIEITEQGTLAITVEGIDHVMSTARTATKEKLLITSVESADAAGVDGPPVA